uniref:SYNE1 n=1 Tax=Hippocampus comes TaxID=109280 RepID=A0A3Q2ZAZ8_HIPCM
TQASTMEQQLYTAVSSTSSWLDGVENVVLSDSLLLADNVEAQLEKQETLASDLHRVAGEVTLSQTLLAASSGLRQEERALLEDNLDCLKERLGALGGALGQSCDHMRTRTHQLTAYQVGIYPFIQIQLFTSWPSLFTKDTKCQVLQVLAETTDRPASEQLQVVTEDNLKEFEKKIAELKSRGAALQADQISTDKILKLQDAYEELAMAVGSRRSGLNQNVALKLQYERALQDLADLVDTAKGKMAADQRIVAASADEVQSHLDKHKEFFQGLESHMILTETYYGKICGLMLPKERRVLEETLNQTRGVLRQSHSKGVELEGILETWRRLVQDYQSMGGQLEAVEESIPAVGLVEETEEKLMERISLYQGLKGKLTEHQHKLQQVLGEGKRLLLSVCCPALENQLAVLGEHWLDNTSKVNKELQRLEAILKHWTRSGTSPDRSVNPALWFSNWHGQV